jgi:hypothetical protein
MSKQRPEGPPRLRTVDGTDMERRLLDAAGRERPSRELSERMARAIGVALPPAGSGTSAGGSAGPTPKAATASGSLLPWLGGGLAVIAVGGAVYFARDTTRGSAPPAAGPAASASTTATMPRPAAGETSTPMAREPAPTSGAGESTRMTPSTASTQRGRAGSGSSDLGDQIALVDAARSALGGGDANAALSLVRKYRSDYPSGAFRPEAAAIKIEALVKLGRSSEARNLAERFVTTYGPGPLADRVAHLAGLSQP